MKKLTWLMMSFLLVFVVVLSSCAKTPTTPTPPTAPTTPTTPTTPAAPKTEQPFKPIKLKYADQRPHRYGTYYNYDTELTLYIRWIKAVEGATNGRIVFETYPSESLFKLAVAEVSVSQGLADVAYSSRITPGIFPLKDMMTLPPVGPINSEVAGLMIYWFFLWEAFDKDHKAMNLIDLAPLCLPVYDFTTAKKPIRGIADIKGLTLMSTKVLETKLFTNLGAIVVPISLVEGYDALAKGVADGAAWTQVGPWLFGWIDAYKPGYFIDSGGVGTSFGSSSNFLMNRQKYDSIPQDLRGIMEEVLFYWGGLYQAAQDEAQFPVYRKRGEARGIQYISWSPEEKAKLQKEKDKIVDIWLDDMEKQYKRGAEAAALLKVYKDAINKYVPPAPMFAEHPMTGGDVAKWEKVWGKPDSTWGRGYKAYPNQAGPIGNHKLEGNEFKPWPK